MDIRSMVYRMYAKHFINKYIHIFVTKTDINSTSVTGPIGGSM